MDRLRLRIWHAQLTDKIWLQPLKPTRWIVILIVLAGIIAAGMNGYVRYWQYEVWEQNSQLFYLDDGTPLFTTTDAPYFLGLAQAIKRDGNFHRFNEMRQYPLTRNKHKENPPNSNLREAPLLSVVLSLMASDSSPKALLEAGHRLIPITAVLTAVMIMLAFGAAGYWLEGSIAAAGGGLSLAYLQRSGAGRIDTDQLNLGFFYLMIGLVIFSAQAKSFRSSIVLIAIAGLTFWVFDWWYSKPFFGWAFFIGFIWLSIFSHSDFKRIILQSALFLLLSGMIGKGIGISSSSSYLVDVLNLEGLVFPNTFETISEIRQISFSEILEKISSSTWLGAISLFGLVLWGLRHPIIAIVFGPAAAFALLNFVIGNRAIFYSSPMLWFGFAWLVVTIAKWAQQHLHQQQLRFAMAPVAVLTGFFCVWYASPTTYVQKPTFDKKTVTHFQNLREILPSEYIVIASWWDYGYLSMLVNGKPTLHDGGGQTGPTTYFIANNLLRHSQKAAALEFSILGNAGYSGVMAYRQSDKKGGYQTNQDDNTIYLVLTQDMTRWMPSISKVGSFDIESGSPYQFKGVRQEYQLRYDDLKCSETNNKREFICNGNKLNLFSGKLGNDLILDGMAISKNGRQTGGRKFPKANSPFVLHSEVSSRANRNFLLHRDLYLSVFHQLFYLNKADQKYFELVYDGFPDMRVFKVL